MAGSAACLSCAACGRGMMRSGMAGMNGLNDDLLSELRADAQTDVAHLTNDIGVLSQKANLLLFAKAHFPETMRDFGGGGKLLDANGSACANVA